MALVKCLECGKEYSDKSEKCIECGCPTEHNISKDKIDVEEKEKTDNVKVEKSKEKPKRPAGIRGDEKLKDMRISGLSWFLVFLPIIFVFVEVFRQPQPDIAALIFGLFIFGWGSIFLYLIFAFVSPYSMGNRKRAKEAFEFYKINIPIYNDLKPELNVIGVCTKEEKNYDESLLKIYTEAYNKNADGIIINGSSVRTVVDGEIKRGKGSVSSKSYHTISASLVKVDKVA